MFRKLSERITILGIQRNILQIEKRKVYEYGLEVILLNGSILCICFLTAISERSLLFYLAFLVFFLPLRVFIGGKHASKSEICFVCSVLFYIVMQKISVLEWEEQAKWMWMLWIVIAFLFLWIVAPVKNRRRTYLEGQMEKNRKRAHIVIIIDFAIFFVCYICFPEIAYYQMILVIGVALIALMGVIEFLRREETLLG